MGLSRPEKGQTGPAGCYVFDSFSRLAKLGCGVISLAEIASPARQTAGKPPGAYFGIKNLSNSTVRGAKSCVNRVRFTK